MLTLIFAAVTLAYAGPAHPVHVTTCEPRLNRASTYAPPVWTPAYYPPRAWYWNDVYGYRYYQPPYAASSTNPMLAIDYTNRTEKTMSQIDFGLIANGNLVAEVRDVGTFSPGVQIRHDFGISRNVFPIRTGLARCVPLRITFADGTKWVNPHLPALRRRLYGSN